MDPLHVDREEQATPVRGVVLAVALGLALGLLVLAIATRLGSAIGG